MTFSPTGSSALFTVAGTPYTFEVDVTQTPPQRVTTADTTEHHIPHGNVTYFQSAGRNATDLVYAAYFVTVAEFEALEGAVGLVGALQTVQDGLWLQAELREVRKGKQTLANGPVEGTVSFRACRIASL